MPTTSAAPEDLGLRTLTDLAERTGVPRRTLMSWIRADYLCVLKLDGIHRSTVAEVHRAAETVQRRKQRTWELEPLPEPRPERLAV